MKSLKLISIYCSFFLSACLFLTSCAQTTENNPTLKWVGTWSTSQQLTEPRNNPPNPPGLNGNTLRQVVHVSLGGEELRLRLSNAFGSDSVEIKSVHVASSAGGSSIETNTDVALTFDGEESTVIPDRGFALSDPFNFNLGALSDVTVTIYFGSVNDEVITGHPGSRTTSYILEGDHRSAPEFANAATTDHWYIIDAIDVMAPAASAALVTLGNSITDGRGSGTNQQNRWPDELSRRFQDNPETEHIAVLNQGIGGNCVTRACLGPAATSRFESDVINQTGIKWLIILEGVNDIGGVNTPGQADSVATAVISAYEDMIRKAHQHDIIVFGATIMPFGGSFYDRPASENARQQINEWIRSGGKFDAVIDLDKALEDPDNPGHLLPEADDGDGLHPSEKGHRLIAEAIDLSLFYQ